MSVKTAPLAAAIGMLLGTTAYAGDFGDIFSIRGYGTLGVAHSSEDRADYATSSYTSPQGAGFSDSTSFDVDSKAGLQIDMKFSDRWSAVVQLVSESNENNTWDGDVNTRYYPSLEWANISYKITDELTIRGGRIVLPLLMSAEFRKVGFANTLIRPPLEVYGLTPYNSSDGGDLSWRKNFGSTVNTARAWYGTNSLRTKTFAAQVNIWGLADNVQVGDLTVHAAYQHVKYTTVAGFGTLLTDFAATAASLPGGIGTNAANAARSMETKYDPTNDQPVKFYNLSATYDPGSWFVTAETFFTRAGDTLTQGQSNYSIYGGARINKFTPYLGYAKLKTDLKSFEQIPLTGLPAPVAAFGAIVNGVIASSKTTDQSQSSISLGVRWDFIRNFDLKAQYDHVSLGSGSRGLFVNQQADFPAGGNANVISVAVDFVF